MSTYRRRSSSTQTHRDFAQSKCLVLILACAPLDRRDEALPDARDELGIGEGLLFLLRLDRCDDIRVGVAVVKHAFQLRDDRLLEGRILALGPPFGDLRQACLAEVLIKRLVVAFGFREECEQVLDAAALEGAGEVLHGLRAQVGAEDERDGVCGQVCVSRT